MHEAVRNAIPGATLHARPGGVPEDRHDAFPDDKPDAVLEKKPDADPEAKHDVSNEQMHRAELTNIVTAVRILANMIYSASAPFKIPGNFRPLLIWIIIGPTGLKLARLPSEFRRKPRIR